MLNIPKIKVSNLVICVYSKVLELYSDHQLCGLVPCPNPRLLLHQNPDLDEENILPTPQQCETSRVAGADAVSFSKKPLIIPRETQTRIFNRCY